MNPTAAFPRVRLAAILLLAAVLRLAFFVGLVSGDPQDDLVYYRNAYALSQEGPRYLQHLTELPPTGPVNPIEQFHVRPLVTYPTAAAFLLAGPGEAAATAWPLLCSLLSVLVVYHLGTRLHGTEVGHSSALLCAFYPLEVIYATRILSDVQVGLALSLGLWLLVTAAGRRSTALATLCGAAAAGACLANGRGLIVLGILAAAGGVLAAARRAPWSLPLGVLAGFGVIFAIEAVVYGWLTGDALRSYHVQAGASLFKYLHEPVSSFDWGPLDVQFTNGRPFELTKAVLLMGQGRTRPLGPFFFLFIAAAIFGLVRRRNRLLIGVAAITFLYLDFGPVRVDWDTATRQLSYLMVFKQERFLLVLSGPLLVLAGDFIVQLGRWRRSAAVLVVLVLMGTSWQAISVTRQYYRAGLEDLRVATRTIVAHPTRQYYGDLWAAEHIGIFSRHRARNVHVLGTGTDVAAVAGACVMIGGSRGVELLADYVSSTLPPFAQEMLDRSEPPEGWAAVLTVSGDINDMRRRDFRIVCDERR